MAEKSVEVWGGIECSIVRVAGGRTRNQLADTGHLQRPGDIDLVAGIGLKTIRYPVLWEMVEAEQGTDDWRFCDERLQMLRERGVSPIAGLLHHGSGPLWTDFLDPEFPDRLAAYAGRVAARYPWISMYTPVNEPFTTARIAGLYGLWHPFAQNESVCFRITVAECLAVKRAMEAIRRVNPEAKLVQTEDFGRIYSTPRLAYQAKYENERRWLAIDLLTGRVTRRHRFYRPLVAAGVDPAHLAELSGAPCPPDIIGIDYYLTSDRVIDHRTELYPGEDIGGNGRVPYVDVAAVRSDIPQEMTGFANRIRELWERYHLPVAVTELHNGCTRDEHLRWFMEGWEQAQSLKEEGVGIIAVTSWSLFGARDWNSMLTREEGYYECGAFDSRYDPPRPTIVAQAIRSLAETGHFDHPVLDRPGWWRREDHAHHASRPLVLAGFERLSSEIEGCCSRRRLRALPSGTFSAVEEALERHDAWALIRIEHRKLPKNRREPVRLHCEYRDGRRLFLEIPSPEQWHAFADTFLDLIVDGHSGEFRCVSPPRGTVMNALVEACGPAASAKGSAA
jgi:beta-glucosidase/6-phospho-beta-glucosidase/beta-galactosidase